MKPAAKQGGGLQQQGQCTDTPENDGT
jgi:hypothetical protein